MVMATITSQETVEGVWAQVAAGVSVGGYHAVWGSGSVNTGRTPYARYGTGTLRAV